MSVPDGFVGARVAVLRRGRGLTQEELANQVGLTGSALAAIERGKSNPRPEIAARLAAALDVGVLDFYPSLSENASPLLRLRLQRGLSQQALADIADLSRSEISHLERGTHVPAPETRDRLATALCVDPAELGEVSTNVGAAAPQLRARAGGRRLRRARLAAGFSQYELAARARITQGHISGLEGRIGWNVRPATAQAIANALGRGVETLFVPAEHARLGGRSQPEAERLAHRVVRQAEAHAREHELLTVNQAAEWAKWAVRSLSRFIEEGRLPVVETKRFGTFVNPIHFLDRDDLKRFAKAQYTSTDGRVLRFYAPDKVLRHELRRGQHLEHAERAADRATERNEVHGRVRIDTGRPPKPDRERWAEMVAELEAEFDARSERFTRQEVLVLVALSDWEHHLEAWPRDEWPPDARDPESLSRREYRRAAARIRAALLRLAA